jgi:hypothetical protein
MRQLSRRGSPDTLAAHHTIELGLRHVGMKDLLARVRPAKCGGSLREWPQGGGPQMSGLMTMAAFGGFLVAHVGNRTV